MAESGSRFATAMDVVSAAAKGQISREELACRLCSWKYEPQYKTTGLADDWEERPNSFDAVEYAYVSGLIDDGAYVKIFQCAADPSWG